MFGHSPHHQNILAGRPITEWDDKSDAQTRNPQTFEVNAICNVRDYTR